MKLRPTEPLVIGRDWHASHVVTIAIHNRGVRERRSARRREKLLQFRNKVLDTLRFRK